MMEGSVRMPTGDFRADHKSHDVSWNQQIRKLHSYPQVPRFAFLLKAIDDRPQVEGNSLRYVRFLDDFPVFPLANIWDDIGGIQNRTEGKIYVVQTAPLAIERCILMTTDPGDLVLDPTCGSGTTA
jgi:hypothetical protein